MTRSRRSASACAAWGRRSRSRAWSSPAGTWLAVILVVGALYLQTHSRLDTLEPQMQHALSEYQTVHTFVAAKRHEEKVRDSILAQIGTISAVDQERYTWSHILDEIAASVPEFTWLTSIAPTAPAAALIRHRQQHRRRRRSPC